MMTTADEEEQVVLSPAQFVSTAFNLPVKGNIKPFSFRGRRYWQDVYDSDATRRLLMCGRQTEKTVREESRVLMADGRRVPIKNVRVGDSVVTMLNDGRKVGVSTVTWKSRRYKKRCIRFKTAMNHELTLGYTHPVRQWGKWTIADDLEVGSRVASVRRIPSGSANDLDRDAVKFIGYMLADGGCGRSITFTQDADSPALTEFREVLSNLQIPSKEYPKKGTNSIDVRMSKCGYAHGILDAVGVYGKLSGEKEVPSLLLNQSEEIVALLLESMWACDGHMSHRKASYDVSYCSTSRRMAEGVQVLLWRLGIPSRIRTWVPKLYKGTDKKAFSVQVRTRLGLERFITLLNVPGKSVPLPSADSNDCKDTYPIEIAADIAAIEDSKQGKIKYGSSLRTSGLRKKPKYPLTRGKLQQYVEHFRQHPWYAQEKVGALEAHLDTDLYWDTIEEVEGVGEQWCYDLEVEGTHNFIVEGVVTHNSTALGNMILTYSAMRKYFKSLYVSPTILQTGQFSNDRIKQPIGYSDILKAFFPPNLTDRVNHKTSVFDSEIRLRNAYLNADRVRGIMTDMLCIDELQDILSTLLPVIEETMFTSDYKLMIYSGTPKSTDNTLAQYWFKWSTQNEWMVPCDRHYPQFWNIPGEDNIPKNWEDGLVCSKCHKPVDSNHDDAHWRSMNPFPKNSDGTNVDIPFQGFRVPQLISPRIDWRVLIDKYHRFPRQRFYNECLGLPYDSGLRPLTRADIIKNCDQHVTMTFNSSYTTDQARFKKLCRASLSVMGIDWGCYSEDTRTLTEGGFKYHWEIGEGEKIAQWDPQTGKMIFKAPKRKIVFDHKGTMVHFKSKNQDLLVTQDHKMAYRQRGKRWKECEAQDLLGKNNIRLPQQVVWKADRRETFELPAVTNENGWAQSIEVPARVMSMDLWLEFLGWVVSEGGLCGKKSQRYVTVTQREAKFPERVTRIREILTGLGFAFSEYLYEPTGDRQFKIYGKQLWSWVLENVGELCADKRIPREFLNLPVTQLRVLFDAAMLGDGSSDCRHADNGAYYSTSSGLIDDMQELALKLGYCSKAALHKPAEGHRKTRYRLMLSPGRDRVVSHNNGNITEVPYDGKAYCFTTSTGYFVTERNGCISLQGNTGENTYSYAVIACMMSGKMQVGYVHRFEGKETEPDRQIEIIRQLMTAYKINLVGADYGGGFDRNYKLREMYGAERIQTFQYSGNQKALLVYDGDKGRWLCRKTEIMASIFNAIKSGTKYVFPRWEELDGGWAQEMLNIFSEYNEATRMTVYNVSAGSTDDGLHALVYATLALNCLHPRPDIFLPGATT